MYAMLLYEIQMMDGLSIIVKYYLLEHGPFGHWCALIENAFTQYTRLNSVRG